MVRIVGNPNAADGEAVGFRSAQDFIPQGFIEFLQIAVSAEYTAVMLKKIPWGNQRRDMQES